jgi:hypothetical protein
VELCVSDLVLITLELQPEEQYTELRVVFLRFAVAAVVIVHTLDIHQYMGLLQCVHVLQMHVAVVPSKLVVDFSKFLVLVDFSQSLQVDGLDCMEIVQEDSEWFVSHLSNK